VEVVREAPNLYECEAFDSDGPVCKYEGEEGPNESEPEIDVRFDPFQPIHSSKPDEKWKDMIRSIKPREPKPPSPEDQRKRIRGILQVMESERTEPTEEQLKEALGWI
jgi:hypothetical protein